MKRAQAIGEPGPAVGLAARWVLTGATAGTLRPCRVNALCGLPSHFHSLWKSCFGRPPLQSGHTGRILRKRQRPLAKGAGAAR